MASIYGVELKNIKTWQGTEGIGMQANVYIDKKRVGQVTDDAWGGCFRYDFDTTELDKRADKYRTTIWNKKSENAKYIKLYKNGAQFEDSFIDEIYNLREIEKSWKKAQKTKWTNVVRYYIGTNGVMRETNCVETISDEELIKTLANQNKCNETEIIIVHRYKKADEFVID